MAKSIGLDELRLGVCYYPEHWEEALWEDDFKRMTEMNISTIRIGEFAWAIFEPEEGVYDFGLFDRALDAAQRHGLQVIMGTPTATPPAWLTHKYPEVLNASIDGTLYRHGMRRHYNYSSPKYRELCAIITREMAEHFKDHPAIVAWQLDNEFNCETNTFYAEDDHAAFREWLREKYGTLQALNEAWGTVVWSQTYTDWEQVHLPRPTVADSPNPHLALDEKRFISDNTIAFARIQAEILREVSPQHRITTNGLFGHLDSHALTDGLLDYFSYDSYPQFSTIFSGNDDKPLLDRKWSLNLSTVRDISPNFCVMEQQAGPGGWVNRIDMPSPRPGQMRLWTYQSVLHGADLVMYFRWRTATVGTEIYWHGLNDYHNRPNRRVKEAARVGKEFAEIGSRIAGTMYTANVAILRDYDNEWDGELDVWHGPLTAQSVNAWYKQLQYRHIPADVVNVRGGEPDAKLLGRYRVLIYPHAAIMTGQTAELLARYVENGGKVIFGARTGYKDERGHCRMQPFPGPVAELCGITVEDFTLIKGTVKAPKLRWTSESAAEQNVENKSVQAFAESFNDILQIEDSAVEVVAEYAESYYAGSPALTRRKQGAGEAWYYGAAFSEVVVDELIGRLGLESPVRSWLQAPEQVEIGIREGRKGRYVFLLNYGEEAAKIEVSEARIDLLTGEKIEGETEIPAYGVRILEWTT
ncbi:beta-galactosidase [Saccharibacillus sp. CPCC 101409]|uniref:beta-galactosidase n=1 Tax=Saccharibacillus sp. CPCC 101409 TaxID=3058041 RepID=UPI002671F310|nr:beta-galactosidase [Saccharibacillus sp. CPCC 101409]MDO3408597.1 beta-galactosidase [Saccharibacillus sp. CPCC 101409]